MTVFCSDVKDMTKSRRKKIPESEYKDLPNGLKCALSTFRAASQTCVNILHLSTVLELQTVEPLKF